jgi:hypothetical protein
MPYGVNVADFLLDLAQGEVEGGSSVQLLPDSSTAAAAAAGDSSSSSDDTAAAGDVKQQQQGHVALVPGAAAAAAGGGGDLLLSGPSAVRALYSSYKHFAAVHKQGFDGEHQLQVRTEVWV